MNLRSMVPTRDRGNGRGSNISVFGSLQREVDRLFDEFTQGLVPASPQGAGTLVPSIEISETDNDIQVAAEMPGLERKDVDISIEDGMLTIRGEKKVEEQKDKNVYLSERSYGVFLRGLELPAGIDPSKVQATMANGVLKITIPKPAHRQAQKVEVKEAGSNGSGSEGSGAKSGAGKNAA